MNLSRMLLVALAGWLWADVLLALFAIFAVANTSTPAEPTPVPKGLIEVLVYNDLDGNGSRTTNEPGLAGWSVSIGGPTSTLPSVTDLAGRVRAIDILPGTYAVTLAVQEGWRNTDPAGAISSKSVTVTAGRTSPVLLGVRQLPPPPRSVGVDKTPMRIVVRTGDLGLLSNPRDLEQRQQVVLERAVAELGAASHRVAIVNAFGRHAIPSEGERLASIGTALFAGSATQLKDVVVFTYHVIVANDSGSAIEMDVFFFNDP